jgi:molybdopterin molybdotransferase
VVLSTGSELVDVGGHLGPGQIFDSNSRALAAAAREAGAEVERVGLVHDDPDLLAATLDRALEHADALVTSGGVSVGAYDVVKQVLAGLGSIRFERVAMQPGMPQGFGLLRDVPVFTLPGNPVSALVSFEVFVRPALRTLLGHADLDRETVTAEVVEPLRSPPGKRSFLRVRLERAAGGGWRALPAGQQGSHQLSALAAANGLLVVPEDLTAVVAGSALPVMVLDAPAGDGPGARP